MNAVVRITCNLIQDLRYGLRLTGKSKGLALAVVISMGLGVGATASVFSFVDSLVFRPLPVPETERVVRMTNATLASPVGMSLGEKSQSMVTPSQSSESHRKIFWVSSLSSNRRSIFRE